MLPSGASRQVVVLEYIYVCNKLTKQAEQNDDNLLKLCNYATYKAIYIELQLRQLVRKTL